MKNKLVLFELIFTLCSFAQKSLSSPQPFVLGEYFYIDSMERNNY